MNNKTAFMEYTGRIILKANLTNTSALGIGSGEDERSDRDVVLTRYPMESEKKISTRLTDNETIWKELPYIPATSFLGKTKRYFTGLPELDAYWGQYEENASFIDCSDLFLTKFPDFINENGSDLLEIRDGIRIDSEKGTVAKGAKFDYELLGPGAVFGLTMIFSVENNYNFCLDLASSFVSLIKEGFDLGAKTSVGFGRMNGEASLYALDFSKPEEFRQWIVNDFEKNPVKAVVPRLLIERENGFSIIASFNIKNSLIIRSYSTIPETPDATHLKSGGKNIISGPTIKGVIGGRAEKIMNTIKPGQSINRIFLESLFGSAEKEEGNEQKIKKNGYMIPSRVIVNEIPVHGVSEEIQTRIQIDRFTGGTVDGALIEEVPLFPLTFTKEGDVHLQDFKIEIKEPQPEDKGLMLLLLKDLWTADLPVGGEKAVGRGVLQGVSATIKDGKDTYKFPEDFIDEGKMKFLQQYVDALNGPFNIKFHKERVDKYKNRKK